MSEFYDAEIELQKDVLVHMERIWVHVTQKRWVVIDAIVEASEGHDFDPIRFREWKPAVWPYFIDTLAQCLEGKRGPHVDEVRSCLREMRLEIEKAALIGDFSLAWPRLRRLR